MLHLNANIIVFCNPFIVILFWNFPVIHHSVRQSQMLIIQIWEYLYLWVLLSVLKSIATKALTFVFFVDMFQVRIWIQFVIA